MKYLKRLGVLAACAVCVMARDVRSQSPAREVHDLSLLVSPELPCVWPVGMTPLGIVPTRSFGLDVYHRDMLMIDEHTGTQWDAPAHFVPPPDSGLPGAGPMGAITGEKVPAWQFCGEACVIDVTRHVDDAGKGDSYLITPAAVRAWEVAHRPLRFGDVVLFRSDYTDKYYRPFPAGDRFVTTALRKTSPGWPAPTAETMNYLADRGVMTAGLDGASMGPLPDLAVATHQAGGKRGMIWTECSTNLGSLPATGGFYAILAAKHAGGSGGECRAIGISEPKLAARLIESAKQKRVADLSVTLDEDYPITWPGRQPGEEASRYVAKTLNAFSKARGPYFARTHMFDSLAGTHVILPSFALPPSGFDRARYPADVQAIAKDFESKHGPLGHSEVTLDRLPLADTQGNARVIDVRSLVGTTKSDSWPASPIISLDLVKSYEAKTRPIAAGDVVVFYSGHSDKHFKPLPAAPELDSLLAAPLAGKAEGWPTPALDVIAYLADRGVRCIGTDGPSLGGVDRDQALQAHWFAAKRGLVVVEYLTNVAQIADRPAYFIFAPIKIKGTRGGYGRAIGLY